MNAKADIRPISSRRVKRPGSDCRIAGAAYDVTWAVARGLSPISERCCSAPQARNDCGRSTICYVRWGNSRSEASEAARRVLMINRTLAALGSIGGTC